MTLSVPQSYDRLAPNLADLWDMRPRFGRTPRLAGEGHGELSAGNQRTSQDPFDLCEIFDEGFLSERLDRIFIVAAPLRASATVMARRACESTYTKDSGTITR